MNRIRILLADDEQPARFGMAKALGRSRFELLEAADGRAALELIRTQTLDLVFLDLSMPVLDGQQVLRELDGQRPRPEIVIVTANDRLPTAVECMRLGAADYLTKPFEIERLRAIAQRTADRVALERRVHDLQSQLDEKTAYGAVIGVSRAIRDLFGLMARAAPAPVDMLIRGETGSGKELIARELHRLSSRAGGPFVAVNVAAIAETLTESELFGHVRGAFTGAEHDRPGVFLQAHGGTLFLDEIGDMPQSAQTKILRVLQDRVVQPVGSIERRPVDVRVISATHRDLEDAVAQGLFRQDLYFRIRGVELIVPPLRQRPEDILLLANYFLERYAARSGSAPCKLSAEAAEALLAHPWPGNVRELEHLVTSAAVLGVASTLRVADLRLPDRTRSTGDNISFHGLAGLPLTEAKAQLVDAFERSAIEAALRTHQGNISAAARQLGIHRQSLQQKMAQLGIGK